MSVKAWTLAQEAGRRIGDEGFSRISLYDWRDFMNTVARDICSRMKVLERESVAGVVANEERVAYPSDMVQIRYLRYSDTPSEIGTYYDLEERPFDDWRRETSRTYPTGMIYAYTPRASWLTLIAKPSATLANALLMGYWALPDEITTMETDEVPLPDFMRDHLRDGMIPLALRKDRRYEEADAAEAVWRSKEIELAKPITDRADDRRERVRTNSRRNLLRMT